MFHRMRLLLSLIILLFFSTIAHAQFEVGSIVGAVTDPTGASIADASVEAIESATNVSRKTTTSSTGQYGFLGLRPGTYVITVKQPGFADQSHTVTLAVSERLEENVAMTVGTASQTVDVNTSTNTIETGSSELGNVRSEKQVQDLPLNSRNFTQLVYLAPGVNNRGNSANSVSQDAARTEP
jgi:hypothetical protein